MRTFRGIFVGIIIGLAVGGMAIAGGPGGWQNSSQDCWGADRVQNYIDKYELGTAGEIAVFNASGVRAEVAMSGDATMTSAGVVSVSSASSADGLSTRGIARAGIALADLSVGTNSLGVVIPDNAVVWAGYVDMTTVFAGTGTAAAVSFELNGSDDLLTSVVYTNGGVWNGTGIKALIPVGTAASAIKMTGARTLSLVLVDEPLTQGVGTVVLYYDLLAN